MFCKSSDRGGTSRHSQCRRWLSFAVFSCSSFCCLAFRWFASSLPTFHADQQWVSLRRWHDETPRNEIWTDNTDNFFKKCCFPYGTIASTMSVGMQKKMLLIPPSILVVDPVCLGWLLRRSWLSGRLDSRSSEGLLNRSLSIDLGCLSSWVSTLSFW